MDTSLRMHVHWATQKGGFHLWLVHVLYITCNSRCDELEGAEKGTGEGIRKGQI